MNLFKNALEVIGTVSKTLFIAAGLIIGLAAFGAVLTRSTKTTYQSISPTEYSSAIVKVMNREGTGGGTGWATKTNKGRAVVITNDHVCGVAVNGYVVLEQRGGRRSIKPILARSFDRDLCVIEGLNIPSLSLAENGPKEFEQLTVYGHPLLNPVTPSYGQYVADGIMQIGFSPEEDGTCRGGQLMIEDGPRPPNVTTPFGVEPLGLFGNYCVVDMELSYTTIPTFPGNSGSPVTNADGEVIGVMNSASSRDNRGNFIPLTYLKDILTEE